MEIKAKCEFSMKIFNKIMPFKKEWLKGFNNVDYLVVNDLLQEQLGEEFFSWVRMQL